DRRSENQCCRAAFMSRTIDLWAAAGMTATARKTRTRITTLILPNLLHFQLPSMQMVRVQLKGLIQLFFAVTHVGRVVVAPAFIVQQQRNHRSMRCGR